MTALMQRALRRLSAVPERDQDRLARHLLSLPELAETEKPSLVTIASEPNGCARTKEEIDRDLDALRDEWDR